MKLANFFKKIPLEIKYVILLFLVTRIILIIIGIFSQNFLESFYGQNHLWAYSSYSWLNIWSHGDTSWYLNIVKNGYSTVLGTSPATLGQANYAFFPLYPLLIKSLSLLVNNNYFAGLIISNICLIIGSVFFYKLVRLDSDQQTSLDSVKYLFLFPLAFILSGVFSESLFLVLLIACFYYAKKEKWLLAGILGFFLSLTKSMGVLVVLPLLYEYLKAKNFKFKKIKSDLIFLFLIPFGLVSFMIYNYFLTGDALAFIHIQSAWGRSWTNLYQSLGELFNLQPAIILLLAFVIGCLVLLTAFYKKIGFSYWFLGFCFILLPLLTSSVKSGMHMFTLLRYVLLVFPLYIILAKLGKNFYLNQFLTISLALIQGFLIILWSNGFLP